MSKRVNLASALHDAGANPLQHAAVRPTAVVSEKGKAPIAPSRIGLRVVTFYVKPEAHKQLRMLSVESEISAQDLMTEALNDLFRKHGRSIIA